MTLHEAFRSVSKHPFRWARDAYAQVARRYIEDGGDEDLVVAVWLLGWGVEHVCNREATDALPKLELVLVVPDTDDVWERRCRIWSVRGPENEFTPEMQPNYAGSNDFTIALASCLRWIEERMNQEADGE